MSEIVLIPSIDAHKEEVATSGPRPWFLKCFRCFLKEINSLQYSVKVLRSYRKAVKVKQFHTAPVYLCAQRAL